MTKKSKRKLPDTASELVQLAKRCLEMCEFDSAYEIDMDETHFAVDGEPTRVGLTGALFAKFYNVDPTKTKDSEWDLPKYKINNTKDYDKLEGLMTLERDGCIQDLMTAYDLGKYSKRILMPRGYHGGPGPYKRWLDKIVDHLRDLENHR